MKAIVVGSGIIGASVAYHLARERAEVILVDRSDPGRATDAGAGIVCPWGSGDQDRDRYAISAAAARYYPELVAALAEEGQSDVSYRQVGAMWVSEDPARLEATERLARGRMVTAPEAGPIDRLTPKEARALFPPLREDIAALRIGGGARVNGRQMAQALIQAAIARGARLIKGSAELLMRGERVEGVLIDGEAVGCDAVVAAAGAWAAGFLQPAQVRLPVAPQRGQIIHLRLPGTDTSTWPTLQPMNSYYLLAFDDSRVVIGASRETGSGFDHRLTAGGVAEVLNAGLSVAPGLAGWTLHETRIGFRPLADDDMPKLGPVRGVENLLIANGLGPRGLTVGPYAGALVAQAALGREPEMPLAAFDPMRANAR